MTTTADRKLIIQLKEIVATIESRPGRSQDQRKLLIKLIDTFVTTGSQPISDRGRSFYHLRKELNQVDLNSRVFLDIAKEIVEVLNELVVGETGEINSILPVNLEALVADYEQALAEANEARGLDKRRKLQIARQKLSRLQAAIDRKKQIWRQEQIGRAW